MTTLVLGIGFPTPSANLWAGRSHWAYKVHQRRWLRYVHEAYCEARAQHGALVWPKPPKAKVRVTIERFTARENALDFDNLVGGCKVALDALREVQLIDDDKMAAIEAVYLQPKNPIRYPTMWTQLTLERLED